MYYLFARYPYLCILAELVVVACLVMLPPVFSNTPSADDNRPMSFATLPPIEDLSSNYTNPTTASEEPPGECTTDGDGGEYADQLAVSYGDGSRQSSYHLYAAGRAASDSYGLVIQLHGDGAWEFDNPEYKLDAMNEFARDNGLLLMSAHTPDHATNTWWQDGEANSMWLSQLLEDEVYREYPIDRSRIWISSYSGGSELATNWFLADQAETICGGGAVISGGGTTSAYMIGDVEWPVRMRENFALHFYTGTADTAENSGEGFDAYSASVEAVVYFNSIGFTATECHPTGTHHDELDEVRQLARVYDNPTSPAC